MVAYYQSFSKEQAAWSEANQEASIPSYQHFLEKFPKGKFGSMARVALKALYEKDEQLWNSALNPRQIQFGTVLVGHGGCRRYAHRRCQTDDRFV